MTAQDMRPPNWREAEALVRINGGAPWLWWSQRRALALAAPAAGVVAGLLLLAPAAEAHGNGHGKGHTPAQVCHKPGTPAEHTLTMDASALPAHLAHGDTLGACVPAPSSSVPCPDPTTSSPEPDPTTSEPDPDPTTTVPDPDPTTAAPEPDPTTTSPEPSDEPTDEASGEPTTDPVPSDTTPVDEPTTDPAPVETPADEPTADLPAADTTDAVVIVPAAATPTDVPDLASDELAYTGADPLLLGVVGAIALAGGVMLTARVRRGGHQ